MSKVLPKLYSYFQSGTSYRLRLALNYKNIEYETVPVNLVQGGHKTSEYEQINPNKRVPTLVMNGEPMSQSVALLETIEEMYPDPPLLPKSPVERHRAREIMSLIATDIHPLHNLTIVNELKGVYKQLECADGDSRVREFAQRQMINGLQVVEGLVSKWGGKYCIGDSVSLADILLVPQVASAKRFGISVAQFPTISKICSNLSVLQPFIKSLPENQVDAPKD